MVVVDSSVLIHLMRIGQLELLKKFFGKIKITKEILRELVQEEKIRASEIKKSVSKWIIVKKVEIIKIPEFEDIEKGDIELILLAEKEKDILLTNDLALITVAKTMGTETWWTTTFLIKLVKRKIINKKQAKEILFDLVQSGLRLKIEVYVAIEKEIDRI
jgi:predicted nucleic acid-binding protein